MRRVAWSRPRSLGERMSWRARNALAENRVLCRPISPGPSPGSGLRSHADSCSTCSPKASQPSTPRWTHSSTSTTPGANRPRRSLPHPGMSSRYRRLRTAHRERVSLISPDVQAQNQAAVVRSAHGSPEVDGLLLFPYLEGSFDVSSISIAEELHGPIAGHSTIPFALAEPKHGS